MVFFLHFKSISDFFVNPSIDLLILDGQQIAVPKFLYSGI